MKARPSTPTPTWALGSFSVRRQRSTTVRPRVSSESHSIATWRCSVVTSSGLNAWATATAS